MTAEERRCYPDIVVKAVLKLNIAADRQRPNLSNLNISTFNDRCATASVGCIAHICRTGRPFSTLEQTRPPYAIECRRRFRVVVNSFTLSGPPCPQHLRLVLDLDGDKPEWAQATAMEFLDGKATTASRNPSLSRSVYD
jgi:hypothetical protein